MVRSDVPQGAATPSKISSGKEENTTAEFMRDMTQGEGGVMGFLDRAGDALSNRLETMFGSENMDRVLTDLDKVLPGLKEGLTELFNKLTGAEHGQDTANDLTHSANDAITTAVYGTADPDDEGERAAATYLQRDPDTFAAAASIGNGIGAIKEWNGFQYGADGRPVDPEERAEEDAAEFREAMEQIDREEERERQWDESRHNFAGMEMTGEEIDSLVDFMNDPAMRQKLIERRAREKHISVEQAEKDVDNARRYADLFKKSETGTLTAEEQREFVTLKNDPAVTETLQTARAASLESVTKHETVAEHGARIAANTADSANAGADILDRPFPAAPELQSEFEAAKAAREPLDAEQPPKPKAVIASADRGAAPPAQVASTGFDV